MKVVKQDTVRGYSWLAKYVTIPKGTPVKPASNLPDGGWWVVPKWPEISREVQAWGTVYGFHLTDEEVEDEQATTV